MRVSKLFIFGFMLVTLGCVRQMTFLESGPERFEKFHHCYGHFSGSATLTSGRGHSESVILEGEATSLGMKVVAIRPVGTPVFVIESQEGEIHAVMHRSAFQYMRPEELIMILKIAISAPGSEDFFGETAVFRSQVENRVLTYLSSKGPEEGLEVRIHVPDRVDNPACLTAP